VRVRRPGLFSAVLLGGAWLLVASTGLAYAALITFLGDVGCEHEVGDSNYGEFSWSVFPPGPVCTWTPRLHGFSEKQGPTVVTSVWLVTLVVLGWLAIRSIRRFAHAARST
jgi:hypothetical protein